MQTLIKPYVVKIKSVGNCLNFSMVQCFRDETQYFSWNHYFTEKPLDFHENQAFWGFRGLVGRKQKHVSKMFPGETLSFTSTNNFLGGFFHETQNKKSRKVDQKKWIPQ